MADRTHDIVLYGATGFTGRLVAAHLAQRAVPGLRWAIAGRSKDRLQEVAEDLGLTDVDIVVADAHDVESLADLAQQAKVVCTTVGPYAKYGSGVVEACVNAGTDYCDLTGEPHWMRRMIDAHQAKAESTGARILHACGFDSIPSDVGTYYVQQQMRERHGVPAPHVRCRLKAAYGSASGGTLSSMLHLLEEAAADPEISDLLSDPYSLNPQGHRRGSDRANRVLPSYESQFGAWAAPFVMAITNAPIVRRSNALLGDAWGADFSYDEAVLTGSGPVGAVTATGLALGMGIGEPLLRNLGLARAVLRRVAPDPGTGPSPKTQRKGFFDYRLHAEHPTDPSASLMARVRGDRDPGYGSTSQMLGETALALAAGESPVEGGFWTTASALGDALLERLPAHAGVTFDILT